MTVSNRNCGLIVALDTSDLGETRRLVLQLSGVVDRFQVSFDLFSAHGPSILNGFPSNSVMLDLKLNDIPDTVGKTVGILTAYDAVWGITVHASGGYEMLRRAVERSTVGSRDIQILAVTVLSSIGPIDLAATGEAVGLDETVELRARVAQMACCDGLLASPMELEDLRRLDNDLTIVTDGIRLPNSMPDGRITSTPGQAAAMGASYVVVGRQLLNPRNPRESVLRIQSQIQQASLDLN
jgi:orotidine-5'-phosphate decarboxylase